MKLLSSLKATLAALEPAKLAALGAVTMAMVMLVGWIAWRSTEPMALLYSGLDPAEAGHIGQRLDELKVPFEAKGDGSSILVPAAQVARVRMELAASGLPHEAGRGYELLDTQSPMNMTSFMQRVQRLRALEGELGRTVLTLDGVKSARVHIVLPERDSFAREMPKPTASVAVIMTTPVRLNARQASAIRLLVAGAVPRLRQEDVSVLDPTGIVLAADGDGLAAGRLEEVKTAREHALQVAMLDLLEPLVGRGRVKAAVSVEIDGSHEISHEEKFDPLSQVERSKQTQVDQDSSDESKPRDAVSVGQNLPNAQNTAVPGKSSTSTTHNGQTVNYELSSTHSERVREPGEVKRLTVAVVVDGITDDKGAFHPRPKEELDRITGLVRSIVGFDAKRGDVVTVETMRFMAAEPLGTGAGDEAAVPAPGLPWLPVAGAVLMLGATIAFLLKRRQSGARRAAGGALAPAPLSIATAEPQPRLAAAATVEPDTVRGALHELIDARPEEALAVIRAWIAEPAT